MGEPERERPLKPVPQHPDTTSGDREITQAELEELVSDGSVTSIDDLFAEAVIPAAMSIVNLALHSHDEKLRFSAGRFIIERLYGKNGGPPGKDPLNEFLKNIQKGDGNA